MVKGKRTVSKEDSSESMEYPSGEQKVRKKGSKLTNNGASKKVVEEPQSAASKKAAAKKRTRKPSGQSRNIWLAAILSFFGAALASALFVYNWSLHDDFDVTRFWTDNEQKIMDIVAQISVLFNQYSGGQVALNATDQPAIEAPPATTA